MQLPPFTRKSCLVFMIGVVSALLAVYFLIAALNNASPRIRVPQPPPANSSPIQ
jgi:hypothetical protein